MRLRGAVLLAAVGVIAWGVAGGGAWRRDPSAGPRGGPEGRIHAVVCDSVRGTPIPQAIVRVRELHRGSLSDSAGVASFALPPGRFELTSQEMGYVTRHDSIEVRSGRTDTIVVRLVRSSVWAGDPVPIDFVETKSAPGRRTRPSAAMPGGSTPESAPHVATPPTRLWVLVRDSVSGKPVQWGDVVAVESRNGGGTNERGWAVIHNLPPGRVAIQARGIGYTSKVETVTVARGRIDTLSIELYRGRWIPNPGDRFPLEDTHLLVRVGAPDRREPPRGLAVHVRYPGTSPSYHLVERTDSSGAASFTLPAARGELVPGIVWTPDTLGYRQAWKLVDVRVGDQNECKLRLRPRPRSGLDHVLGPPPPPAFVGRLRVVVRDSVTRAAVPRAWVSMSPAGGDALTDDRGESAFWLRSGHVIVHSQCAGFVSRYDTVEVGSGYMDTLQIFLRRPPAMSPSKADQAARRRPYIPEHAGALIVFVSDFESGRPTPFAGVAVMIPDTAGWVADEQGRAKLAPVSAGRVVIRSYAVGRVTKLDTVLVREGGVDTVRVRLHPARQGFDYFPRGTAGLVVQTRTPRGHRPVAGVPVYARHGHGSRYVERTDKGGRVEFELRADSDDRIGVVTFWTVDTLGYRGSVGMTALDGGESDSCTLRLRLLPSKGIGHRSR